MAKGKTKDRWTRLDQFALDIEFLLISVVQGVALATLATASLEPIEQMQWQALPYIATAFLVVLIFWSGAIIHALSFIDWPLDLIHSFLYFLASFAEVLAFSHVTSPTLWFVFILLFQIVAALLYLYDLRIIQKHKPRFRESSAHKALFTHILTQQKQELKTYVPLAIIYSLSVLICFFLYKTVFLEKGYHLLFILGQLLFSVLFLRNAIQSFQKRSFLLEKSAIL